jgi:hypothetical protein
VLGHVLPRSSNVGQVVAEPGSAEYAAGGRFERALRPLEDHHVIGLASGLEDTGDHRHHEHAADAAVVFGVLGAKIGHEPTLEPGCAIPLERG